MRPKGSKGTLIIVIGGLALVLFFIVINAFDSKSGGKAHTKTGTPPAPLAVTSRVEGTPTAKPLLAGTLSASTSFTSLQGYKLSLPSGWRVLPLHGPLNTDLILQAPEPHKTASVFTITVTDASKRVITDPIQELPPAKAIKSFVPLPPKRLTLDGAPAAEQEGTIMSAQGSAHVWQVFASHHKRAYNFTGICPQAQFKMRLAGLRQMLDSLKWIPPKQPAPAAPNI